MLKTFIEQIIDSFRKHQSLLQSFCSHLVSLLNTGSAPIYCTNAPSQVPLCVTHVAMNGFWFWFWLKGIFTQRFHYSHRWNIVKNCKGVAVCLHMIRFITYFFSNRNANGTFDGSLINSGSNNWRTTIEHTPCFNRSESTQVRKVPDSIKLWKSHNILDLPFLLKWCEG